MAFPVSTGYHTQRLYSQAPPVRVATKGIFNPQVQGGAWERGLAIQTSSLPTPPPAPLPFLHCSVTYKGVLMLCQFPQPLLTQQWLPRAPALLEVLGRQLLEGEMETVDRHQQRPPVAAEPLIRRNHSERERGRGREESCAWLATYLRRTSSNYWGAGPPRRGGKGAVSPGPPV